MQNSRGAEFLLSMEGISKSFSGVEVLHGVNFDLRPGEVHVLAGENGAGKSTLIKIIAGVHADFAGELLLRGQSSRFRTPHEANRHGISVIHQEMSLIGPMSVADNIFLGREHSAAGFLKSGRQAREARRIISELGLHVDVRAPLERYPISVQQMIEIAKALAFDARIIIMDEPTSALSDPEVEKLFTLIAQLKARGCGIIYITHKMEEIYRIADRITVLRDGNYIGTSPAAELPRARLIQWMVGREITEQIPPRSAQPGPPRLRVDNLSIPDESKPGKFLVEDISFEARAGEIVGIAGLQGSGNSALLHGIFGDLGKLGRGGLQVNGRPYAPRSPRHAIRSGIALLTNDRKANGLVLGMDIISNLTLPSLPAFSPGGWIRPGSERVATEALSTALRLRAAGGMAAEVQTLSGGNQQKVVLGKWLETKPQILLLDEPTRGVDVGAKHEIYKLMNQWTQEGLCILLITSEMPELLALADRILVLSRGRLTARLERPQFSPEAVLQAAMGGAI